MKLKLFVVMITLAINARLYSQESKTFIEFYVDHKRIDLSKEHVKLYEIKNDALVRAATFSNQDSVFFLLNSGVLKLGLEYRNYFLVFESVLISSEKINHMEIGIDNKPYDKNKHPDVKDWRKIKSIYYITAGTGTATVINQPMFKKSFKYFSKK